MGWDPGRYELSHAEFENKYRTETYILRFTKTETIIQNSMMN